VLDLVASNGHSQRRGSKKHANDGVNRPGFSGASVS
jgi:hypothetical protein